MKKTGIVLCCIAVVLSAAACGSPDTPSWPAPVDAAAPEVAQPVDDPAPPSAQPENAESDVSLPFEIPLSDAAVDLQDPPPLVTTWEGFLYIDNDHELCAAGAVPYYQFLFEGLSFSDSSLTRQIVVEKDVRSVSLSSMSSCLALMYTSQDGRLWEYGSLTSKAGDVNEARHVMDDVYAVAVGYQHVLALRSDGTLWGWGSFSGERADTPVKIAENVIAATDRSFLKSDGTLWLLCEYSSVNAGPGLAGITPQKLLDEVVFAGRASAVKTDGTVWYWEESTSVPDAVKVFEGAIACGEDYVITKDDRLIYWPEGFDSDLTTEITDDAVYAVKTRDYSIDPSREAFVVLNKARELELCYIDSE